MLFDAERAGEPPQPSLAVWLKLEPLSPAFARSIWGQSHDGLTTRLESRRAWQARLVDLVKTIAVRSNAVTGAIGRNAEISLNPPIGGPHPVEATCAEYVRGHYWGLVLGPRQIDELGGVARVVADAPFAVAESFGTPEHPLVYLQATETAEDEWTPPDEIVRFLLPVTHPDGGGTLQTIETAWHEGAPSDEIVRFLLPVPLPDSSGTRIVPPPIGEDYQPEGSGTPEPRYAATHKWEADDAHGEVIGPLIVWDNQTDTFAWESDDWITRTEAERLADENGWSLGFDG